MSERGSFVTEFIYCDTCLAACEKVLCGTDKYLCGQRVHVRGGGQLRIIAGKIGGSFAGGEFYDMDFEYLPAIQALMCKKCCIRIAILSNCAGSRIYEFTHDDMGSPAEIEKHGQPRHAD